LFPLSLSHVYLNQLLTHLAKVNACKKPKPHSSESPRIIVAASRAAAMDKPRGPPNVDNMITLKVDNITYGTT
jgi:hypothetical protein